jgi:hypothetical protein
MEAPFDAIDGVLATTSGYTGGSVQRPTYLQTCTGTTGHAEAVQILFDTSKTSYEKLLDVFWCAPRRGGVLRKREPVTHAAIVFRQAQHQPDDAKPAVRGPRAAVPQRRLLPHARAKGRRGA